MPTKEYYAANRARILEVARIWRLRNKDRVAGYNRKQHPMQYERRREKKMTKQFERAKEIERRVLALYTDLAESGLPSMTNTAIAKHLGLTIPEVAAANKRLRRRNMVQFESKGWRRRVSIVDRAGPVLRTDWTGDREKAASVDESKASRPEADRSREKYRKCLRCGNHFLSQNPGVRKCPECCLSRQPSADLWGDADYVLSL